jgi:hypothetical protein
VVRHVAEMVSGDDSAGELPERAGVPRHASRSATATIVWCASQAGAASQRLPSLTATW